MNYNKILCLMVLPLTFSCSAKPQKKAGEIKLIETDPVVEKKADINPDEDKIDRILAMMSVRAQTEITILDKKEFLKDLNEILEEEKTFRKDDVSLFYLIDKKHHIGAEYEPKDIVKCVPNDDFYMNRNDLSLRPEAYDALVKMARAAKKEGIKTLISSTYRSYQYQDGLFKRYAKNYGEAEADRFSARPGTSQHQLGTAIDFGSVTNEFADTKLGRWIYQHGAEYGWSLSFPKGYEPECGYMWESWHFRYIGTKACAFQKKYFNDIQQFMLEFIDFWKNN